MNMHHAGCNENRPGFRLHQVITAPVITFMSKSTRQGGEIFLSAKMVDERPTLAGELCVAAATCAF